jgi:RNA polymerase sigma-70 factor (ECF subfamily)
VAAAQDGDRRALEQLLRGQYDKLYAVCRRVTGNDTDAADAAQDTLIGIVRGLPTFDRRAAFTTWAYRIAVNASLDELRRRRRRPLALVDDREPVDGIDPAANVEARVAERLRLDDALAQLPEEFRVAVVLRDICDLDYAEIASVLGIPAGTVRSRIARGRAALASALGGNRPAAPERPTRQP